MDSHARKKLLLKSLKIAAGSGLAITLTELLGLSYATSAGIIALLTVHDTKQGTKKMALVGKSCFGRFDRAGTFCWMRSTAVCDWPWLGGCK